jgi:hypothetical protein
MLTLWRRWSAAVVFTAVGAGLMYFSAAILPRLGLDFGELAALQRQLDEVGRVDEELDHHRGIVLRRIVAKQQVVGELQAGRLTLLQAAARFRDLEEALPVTRGWPPRATSGPAEGERWCREVMAWAQTQHGEYLPDLAARLEADLRRHRGTDGTVRLPD